MSLTRRQMMQRSLALAAVSTTTACGPTPPPRGDPVADAEARGALRQFVERGVERDLGDVSALDVGRSFPLGVASGDVEGDRVRLWTRYLHDADIAIWVQEEDTGEVVCAKTLLGVSNQVVQVTLDGFAPGTRLRFAFVETVDDDGEERVLRSDMGRVVVGRADDDMRPLVLGTTSCTSNRRDLSLLAEAGARDLDLFISLGDTVYADTASSVADYRGYWAHNLGTRGYRTLRASTALYATWDDHEVSNNWDPEVIDDDKVAAAREVFFEHLPRDLDPVDENRVWRKRRYGTCAEIFLLDSRSERTPSSRLDPDGEYLSRAQLDWLKEGLHESNARFKLIASSVPIAQLPFPMAEEDRWQGWAASRDEILRFIDAEQIEGILWLSGDIHMAFAGRVSAPGLPGENQVELCCGPAAQFTNPTFPWFGLPQFDFRSGENNWAELSLDPVTGIAGVKFWSTGARLIYENWYQL